MNHSFDCTAQSWWDRVWTNFAAQDLSSVECSASSCFQDPSTNSRHRRLANRILYANCNSLCGTFEALLFATPKFATFFTAVSFAALSCYVFEALINPNSKPTCWKVDISCRIASAMFCIPLATSEQFPLKCVSHWSLQMLLSWMPVKQFSFYVAFVPSMESALCRRHAKSSAPFDFLVHAKAMKKPLPNSNQRVPFTLGPCLSSLKFI